MSHAHPTTCHHRLLLVSVPANLAVLSVPRVHTRKGHRQKAVHGGGGHSKWIQAFGVRAEVGTGTGLAPHPPLAARLVLQRLHVHWAPQPLIGAEDMESHGKLGVSC